MSHKRTDPDYQAQAILSRRDHSIFEVQTKMRRKGFTAAQIHSAIAKLKNLCLLDDHAFAHKYVKETLHFKAVGRRWLVRGLRQKGIGEPIINEALAKNLTPTREQELISQATAKWRRLHPSTGSGQAPTGSGQAPKDRQRLTRFLTSRGFSLAAITSVLKAVLPGETITD